MEEAMSVELSSHGIHQRAPRFRQAIKLLSFDRMIQRNLLKQSDLVGHQRKIRNWPLPCSSHLSIAVQGLSALDDALIGFCRGHGARMPHG